MEAPGGKGGGSAFVVVAKSRVTSFRAKVHRFCVVFQQHLNIYPLTSLPLRLLAFAPAPCACTLRLHLAPKWSTLFGAAAQTDRLLQLNTIDSRMASLGGVPKVLFIGNSLTYFNNGLWTHVKVSLCVAVHNVSSIVRKHPNFAALFIL
jgi:hypothetical protein